MENTFKKFLELEFFSQKSLLLQKSLEYGSAKSKN